MIQVSTKQFTINRETVNPRDLVGERLLLKHTPRRAYASDGPEEYKLLEVSESGQYLKLQNDSGRKFWAECAKIEFVERLPSLKARPVDAERVADDARELDKGAYDKASPAELFACLEAGVRCLALGQEIRSGSHSHGWLRALVAKVSSGQWTIEKARKP